MGLTHSSQVVGQFAIRSTEVCHSRGLVLAEAGKRESSQGLLSQHVALIKEWMPAFAGMTQEETDPITVLILDMN